MVLKSMAKKVVVVALVCGLAISGVASAAAAKQGASKAGNGKTKQTTKVCDKKKDQKEIKLEGMSLQDLQKVAIKLGIDPANLTKDELIQKIKEVADKKETVPVKKPCDMAASLDKLTDQELRNVATKMGIDPTNLSRAELIKKLTVAMNKEGVGVVSRAACTNKAEDLDKLTDEELRNLAAKVGIDPANLSRAELIKKIIETMDKESSVPANKPVDNKKAVALDKLTDQELNQVAAKLGIDVTGLSRAEIIKKIEGWASAKK